MGTVRRKEGEDNDCSTEEPTSSRVAGHASDDGQIYDTHLVKLLSRHAEKFECGGMTDSWFLSL